MIFLASYAPNGRYVMPTDHMRCLVAWTGDLGALEAVRKLLRAPNDTTICMQLELQTVTFDEPTTLLFYCFTTALPTRYSSVDLCCMLGDRRRRRGLCPVLFARDAPHTPQLGCSRSLLATESE